ARVFRKPVRRHDDPRFHAGGRPGAVSVGVPFEPGGVDGPGPQQQPHRPATDREAGAAACDQTRDLRFRLIDTAGSEIGVVTHAVADVEIGDTVRLPDGRPVAVVEVYDDEFGREGGVHATLVVDADSDAA